MADDEDVLALQIHHGESKAHVECHVVHGQRQTGLDI
jgi:hypothetical protein